MDTEKTQSILQLLSTPGKPSPNPRPLSSFSHSHKISKPKHKYQSHPTISYFRSISSRRVHTPEPELPCESPQTFQPYNRTQLLSRIQSFNSNGGIGPLGFKIPLTPLDISRNGWSCIHRNQIRCVSCHTVFHLKFPDLESFSKSMNFGGDEIDEEYYEAVIQGLCEKYKLELIESHGKNCPWRKIQTPKNCYDLNVDAKYLDNYKIQVREIHDVNIKTKYIEDEDILIKWCDENDVKYDNIDILKLVLLGWKPIQLPNGLLLSCGSCGRRFITTDEEIDLIDQHNDWCCFNTSYPKVLEFMKSLFKKETTDGYESEDDIKTLQRLDKLRKIIF
ncbi:mRNA export factor rsm1 [Wickerhamomyces ciferrii]|uniref:mRNA export factor rsm1 n=1 Tax=Wickerhamomyces ciferrii (strain ATCC 14091 / BCRC 22168 / CBS 111 / JCM 3599 / NBRC 0793 / NRRL Y-1031 F-60-10) TaxID=1206466 RepID=K0KV57_WICCF|nr:mRNA export factor rsm1 [Wickerhamomyces ciferrii]CCH45314.1 mRNA export factor rsm1 [Wickerhamomyces ciferrii]